MDVLVRARGLAVWAALVFVAGSGCGSKDDSDKATPSASKADDGKRGKRKLDGKTAARRMDRSLARFNRRGYTFGIKAAKIVYKVDGPMEKGTITAWIADSGAVIGVVRELTVRGAKAPPVKQTVLWRDGKNTQWNDKTKTVYITRLRSKATELRLISSDDPKMFKLAGYEKQPDETVAGKRCQVWQSKKNRVKLWRWQGIDLRYDNATLPKLRTTREATSVEEGVAFPSDVFTPPADYKVNDRTK